MKCARDGGGMVMRQLGACSISGKDGWCGDSQSVSAETRSGGFALALGLVFFGQVRTQAPASLPLLVAPHLMRQRRNPVQVDADEPVNGETQHALRFWPPPDLPIRSAAAYPGTGLTLLDRAAWSTPERQMARPDAMLVRRKHLERWVFRRDGAELVVGGVRAGALEEDADLCFPPLEVGAQDRDLLVVAEFPAAEGFGPLAHP